MIRKLTAQDAEEVTRLLVANREQHRPFLPLLSDTFFTVDAQRDRLAVSDHVYGILDADALEPPGRSLQKRDRWLLGRRCSPRTRPRN
jgi:hypothetical protein